MKRFLPLLSLAALLCTQSSGADNTTYTTNFRFYMVTGGQTYDITGNVDQDNPIPTPVSLSHWVCTRSQRALTDDGQSWVSGVFCLHGNDTVGASVVCKTGQNDYDSGSFSLVGKSESVHFIAGCATQANKPTPTPTRHI